MYTVERASENANKLGVYDCLAAVVVVSSSMRVGTVKNAKTHRQTADAYALGERERERKKEGDKQAGRETAQDYSSTLDDRMNVTCTLRIQNR